MLSCKYINIKILLDKARSIEKIKKDIISNLFKQEKSFISKFGGGKSSKRFAMRSESAIPAGKSATSIRRFAKGLVKAETRSSEDYIHSNLKFELTIKKPEEWVRS